MRLSVRSAWGPCSFRHPWWTPGNRCWQHGPFGRCIEHWLYNLRWEWERKWLSVSVDLSNINRPYLLIDEERPIKWVSAEFGNRGSDPVLSVVWRRSPARQEKCDENP